ncbi:glycoprotein-N-acetylgalactosamine 3-beta-galactosyltransferase 1 [Drosophila navojoa]|uniref:glycoprotein-N-acetylgalactosamine 3-beta-galactosyltransferase 1 n=1 Tax=Drosophila navojoa TaxID=7232 RepID=UPI0011BDE2B8|nr:glycoprotein-N-acetylgalactosamine 3-beta-galactosyltransferase 1 [Drosophila navojoa]
MLLERLKRILGPTLFSFLTWALIVFAFVEFYLFIFSSTRIAVQNYLLPPYKENIRDVNVGNRNEMWDNHSIANELYHKVRIHCLLHLTNDRERLKAKHIQKTWGTRCNRMYISEVSNVNKAYRRIARTQYEDLDWLLHVHVDSYVIMENLRYKLASYRPERMIYFSASHAAYPYAHVSLKDTTDYIFSRSALQEMLRASNDDDYLANMEQGPNEQLFPFEVPAEILPFTLRRYFWNWPFIYRAVYSGQGFNSNMEMPIILPYVDLDQIYVLEFMLYHLRPYGHVNGMPALPAESVMQQPALPVKDKVKIRLYREVRILCMVFSYPHKYEQVVRTLRKTWARHCNKLIVFSTQMPKHQGFGAADTIALNVTEGYNHLWGKTKAAFRHVYTHHLHEADWFYKVDDDTYAILENMRFMLINHHADEPIYFGCNFQAEHRGPTYMSGGAGYVLSNEAVRRLVENGIYGSQCNPDSIGTEDYEMGVCLNKLNVTAGDSRDKFNRYRFLPVGLPKMLVPGIIDKQFWLYHYVYFVLKEGIECCSSYIIAIHYVVYYQMYIFEYFLYQMRPYGIILGHEPLANRSLNGI